MENSPRDDLPWYNYTSGPENIMGPPKVLVRNWLMELHKDRENFSLAKTLFVESIYF